MRKIDVTNVNQIQSLYNAYALTWEGLETDDEDLEGIIDWLDDLNVQMINEDFYIIPGYLMNDLFGLTEEEDDPYPDDLNIVCVKLTDLQDFEILFLDPIREDVGAEFFNVIVNNIMGLDEDDELDFETMFMYEE